MSTDTERILRTLLASVAPTLTLTLERPLRSEPVARVEGRGWALQRPVWDALSRLRRAQPGGGMDEVWRVWTEQASCPVCGVPGETWGPCRGCLMRERGVS
jgi:hypothetical protein